MNKLDILISLAQPVRDEIKMGMFSTFQGTPQELEESDEAYSLTYLGQVEDSHILYETEYGTPWITNITDEEAEYIKQHITDIPLTSDNVQQLWEMTMEYDNCIPYVFTNSQREFIKKICESMDYIYSSVYPHFYSLLDFNNAMMTEALGSGFYEFDWRDCNNKRYNFKIYDVMIQKFLIDCDYKYIFVGDCKVYGKWLDFLDFIYFIMNVSKVLSFSEDDYKVIYELFSVLKPLAESVSRLDDPIDDYNTLEDWITEELKHSQSLSLDELKKSFEDKDWIIDSYC
jgi:hypothetical protein